MIISMSFDLSWGKGLSGVAGTGDRAASGVAGGRARLRRLPHRLAPGAVELGRLRQGAGRTVAPRSWPVDGRGAEAGAQLLHDLRGIDLRLAALGLGPTSGLRP
jgi:hypothetical protein